MENLSHQEPCFKMESVKVDMQEHSEDIEFILATESTNINNNAKLKQVGWKLVKSMLQRWAFFRPIRTPFQQKMPKEKQNLFRNLSGLLTSSWSHSHGSSVLRGTRKTVPGNNDLFLVHSGTHAYFISLQNTVSFSWLILS